MAPRTPPGALPGAPEPAVVRCVVMKGGRSRTTRSGRIPALSFLSALLPSSIYLTRGIVALVESRLQSARAWGEGRICDDHRAAGLRGDRHDWRPGWPAAASHHVRSGARDGAGHSPGLFIPL